MTNERKTQSAEQLEFSRSLSSVDRTRPLELRCRAVLPTDPRDEAGVADRQERIPGFSQSALSRLTVLIVGVGAKGCEIAQGLVRKGVGTLKLVDFDTVALSNLNRQFYFPEDINHPKAWALARNLQPHGAMGTRIIAWALSFEEAQERHADLACDVVVAAADDGRTAVAISRFATAAGIPAISGGASRDATFGNIFIQEPGAACYGCAFPNEAAEGRNPCPGSPAVKELFMGLASYALYAIDSLYMDRPRLWNFHSLCLADPEFTSGRTIPRRANCPLCGGG